MEMISGGYSSRGRGSKKGISNSGGYLIGVHNGLRLIGLAKNVRLPQLLQSSTICDALLLMPDIAFRNFAASKFKKIKATAVPTMDAPKRETNPKKRVVITGMGLVSVFGSDVDVYYDKLLEGTSGISLIDRFDASDFTVRFAGQLCDFSLTGYIDGKNHRRLDDCARYCIIAGKRALEDAVLCTGILQNMDRMRIGGFTSFNKGVESLVLKGYKKISSVSSWVKALASCEIKQIMESLEHAMKRGANIIAEYSGGATSYGAHHVTKPRSDGHSFSYCLTKSLEDACVSPEEVNYVNAHATLTQAGDLVEVNSIKKVFNDTSEIKMNGTKSPIGHGLGASGGLEDIVTIKAITTGWLHPTINQDNLEPEVTVDTVPNVKKQHRINVAISNSFGFGGQNSVVVFAIKVYEVAFYMVPIVTCHNIGI